MSEFSGISFRALTAGILIGVPLCFTNVYFGLQTGWSMSMAMPAALVGHGAFKACAMLFSSPLTIEENVFMLAIAAAAASMPLTVGILGPIPTIQFLAKSSERGLSDFSLGSLIIWSIGVSLFGPIFARLLRNLFVVTLQLRFPNGAAVAAMLGVLFQKEVADKDLSTGQSTEQGPMESEETSSTESRSKYFSDGWEAQIRLMLLCVFVGGAFVMVAYFLPVLRDVPFLGHHVAEQWMWTINLSPAYLGQGVLMGPSVSLHMLIGCIFAWAVLSPLVTSRGWVTGPANDWENGSRGWVVWVSLAIMLADMAITVLSLSAQTFKHTFDPEALGRWTRILPFKLHFSFKKRNPEEAPLLADNDDLANFNNEEESDNDHRSQPLTNEASNRSIIRQYINSRKFWLLLGLIFTIVLSVPATSYTFKGLMPGWGTIASVLLSLIISIMSIKAAGEVGEVPVSGLDLAKVSQAVFGVLLMQHGVSSVLVNLVAGAIGEAGAHSSQHLMHDFKTGYLLGTCPEPQLYGMLLGSLLGAIVASGAYVLFATYYDIPGKLFQIPTAYIWLQAARLFTGEAVDVPEKVSGFALASVAAFAVIMTVKLTSRRKWVQVWLPSATAFSIGMYNSPSFTLMRAIGGVLYWYWVSRKGKSSTTLVIAASGFILGEGIFSFIGIILMAARVPRLRSLDVDGATLDLRVS